MRVRTRIAINLAASLTLAGTLALAVEAMAFRSADYPTWPSYRDELMGEMLVTREDVTRALSENPELIFEPGDERSPGGPSLEDASEAVQQRAIDRAAARSRRWSVVAFLVVLAGAVVSAWVLAGRILRPVRLVTEQARAAAEDDLSVRVSLAGPKDEIRELGDTFDVMLDRIAHSFEAQRRFSAQVSHELRAPLALMRTEIDLLVDDIDDAGLRDRLARVADATGRADRLVSQLSVLARADAGDLTREVFGFDELVGNVVGAAMEAPELRDVRVDLDLEAATVAGDRALIESLVRNLVHNAGRHNRRDGWARVAARPSPDGDGAELVVSNSLADVVDVADVADGGEPSPAGPPGQPHIGLTIVAAAIEAHDGSIEWRYEPGSVTAVVRLPAPTAPGEARSPN
jgi:signal transduction histidine kinase